jgi:hypothetical protein
MPALKPPRPAHVQLIAIAWNFGWPVVAGVVVGYWLDGKLGSSPVATLALGLGAMMGAVWRLIELGKREAAERFEAGDGEVADHADIARRGDEEGDSGRDGHGEPS